jgi:hypothetical protein
VRGQFALTHDEVVTLNLFHRAWQRQDCRSVGRVELSAIAELIDQGLERG